MTRDQINKTQEIDLDEFVRRYKAHEALYRPEPVYEELDPSFNNKKEDEGTDAYS